MPASQLVAQAEEQRKKTEALLHDEEHEITLKDLAWLMLDMDHVMVAIATCISKPPSWFWNAAREAAVKTGVPVALGVIVWVFLEFVRSGFRLP